MVAVEAIVRETAALACNCRALVGVANRFRAPGALVDGDLTVRVGAWDCPSCGLDKRRALAAMVAAAHVYWLITLTLEQPRAVRRGQPVTPAGFESCDRFTHVYWYVDGHGKRSLRWRSLASCSHCVTRVSAMRKRWVQRVRRDHPEFQYLDVIEDHKSGAFHLHFAALGIPVDGDRRALEAELRAHWRELGGGRQVDLRRPPKNLRNPGAVGWYLGKYLAKRHEQRMAKRHRRWGRSRGFAPEVLMAWSQKWRERWAAEQQAAAERQEAEQPADPGPVREIIAWRHPLLHSYARHRVWVDPPPTEPE